MNSNFSKVTVVIILIVLYILYRLFIITQCWNYIAVQMFGLPVIGMWKAFAINSLFWIFAYQKTDYLKKESSKDNWFEQLINNIVGSFLTMSFLWGLTYFIFG